MLAVTRLVAPELRGQQIGGMRDRDGEIAVLSRRGAVPPAFGQFVEHGFRHEIDVPAVRLLEFAADDCIIAQPCQLFRIGHWIGVHAVFRQAGGAAFLRGMPEKRRRTNQHH